MKEIKIAVLASGSGTNAENIIRYFKNHQYIKIALVLSNRPDAFVLSRAEKLGVTNAVFNREEFVSETYMMQMMQKYQIDFIVLAGFLWLIPDFLIRNFNGKIVNIHPALLPKYGGRNMYGEKVHQAVFDNKETETGITIHFVNEKYDEGEIIFQAKCSVSENDGIEEIAQKVHQLEYKHFPVIIEKTVNQIFYEN